MGIYKQLTQEQRYHIQALLKTGHTQTEIAEEVKVHKSTISREIKRNKQPNNLYRAKTANIWARKRRFHSKKAVKMTLELIQIIEEKLKEDWSPEQISGWLALNTSYRISHERIYQHVHHNKSHRGKLFHHLRHRNKRYCRRGKGHSRDRIKNRVSIENRPSIVDEKLRFGDWEADTIIGKGHKGAIVTLVERKSHFLLMKKLGAKTAAELKKAIVYLLRPIKTICHTITNDNGTEFAYHEAITKALGASIYFAAPNRPQQRGLNEQVNGLIRQYLPKKTDFSYIGQQRINEIMEKINNRPRKSLGFKTPLQVLQPNSPIMLHNLMNVALQT